MDFRILGSLEVEDRGQSLPLGGHQQRALLALLLLRANNVVPVDEIIEHLWGHNRRRPRRMFTRSSRSCAGGSRAIPRA